jgi:EAL domain-containing protein (putative c-di-GMP-specific phosphodiesterase class I)
MYCFYTTGINDQLQAREQLTLEMQDGIAHGEFFLEFQPRFHAQTRSIQSTEALVRWNHPLQGRMAPDQFIPLAERNGLILPLGEWVLHQAYWA